MSEYKYYLKKPKGEIIKDILLWLAVGGAVAVAASSPYFASNCLRAFSRAKRYKQGSVLNAFYRLKRTGYISTVFENHQMYISLTEEGRKKAGRFQINNLQINKPKKWDRKWRIVIFDIRHKQRVKREALRGFLKRLGFYQLQKSVWVHPYNCEDEIRLLRSFFGFQPSELCVIVAEKIEKQESLEKYFHLSTS